MILHLTQVLPILNKAQRLVFCYLIYPLALPSLKGLQAAGSSYDVDENEVEEGDIDKLVSAVKEEIIQVQD